VRAEGKGYIDKEREEVCFLTLFFGEDTVVHIHISWLAPSKFRRMVIVGSKKMIVYDDIETIEKVKVYDRGVEVMEDYNSLFGRQLIYRTGDVYTPKLDQTEPLRRECGHFIDCIKNKRRPQSDGYCGLRTVKVLEAAQRSLDKDGEVVRINRSNPLL
jgi:predicted dehydrogenase